MCEELHEMLTINTACGTVASPCALTDAARRLDRERERTVDFNNGCVSLEVDSVGGGIC